MTDPPLHSPPSITAPAVAITGVQRWVLIEYARLFQYEAQHVGRRRPTSTGPVWLRRYPVFPRVLFALTGA